jgi:tripartite-type tricarboxylate transporter receptor subunit TctC
MPTISRRVLLSCAAAMPAAAILSRAAFAAYPDRPVRLMVPFAAGGNVDIVARLVGERMAEALGQAVIVENRAGAGGSLCAEQVARAEPDGFTLLAGSNGPLTVNPFVQARLGYDPLKDFAPIGLTSAVPHALAVTNSLPAKTLAELIALAKQRQVSTGTAGAGSATHLTLERFNQQAGIKLLHIPYRGGGALLPDLLGGAIDAAMTEFSSILPLHREGKCRILAIAAAQRSKLTPEVPTMSEGGVKDFAAASFVGILAPAGTPHAIVDQLQQALGKSLAASATQERLRDLGAEVATAEQMTAAGFGAFLSEEFERSREAAQIAGLKRE